MDKRVDSTKKSVGLSPATWTDLPVESAIKMWSSDLKRLVGSDAESDAWVIAGQAVAIEANDADDVRELMHHVAGDACMQLHVLSNAAVIENFPEWFKSLSKTEPAIIYLEPGIWQGDRFHELNEDAAKSIFDEDECIVFREQLIDLMITQLADKPVVLVTAVKTFGQLNVGLRKSGLFDRRIAMPYLNDTLVANSFIEEVGSEILAESVKNDQTRLASFLRNEYPDRRRRMLMQKSARRISWRFGREIEFEDLVQFAVYGTGESDRHVDDKVKLVRHAVHEAGHAVVSHLGSQKKSAPSYCSVIKRDDSHGITVTAYDGNEQNNDDPTYSDLVHRIQMFLGGRAAELLLLGAEAVSAKGSVSDLERATQLASSMFAVWGLPPDTSTLAKASKNLAVVIGDASVSESQHVECLVRDFLEKMMLQTVALLADNQTYLTKVVDALIDKHMLIQTDFCELLNESHAETSSTHRD